MDQPSKTYSYPKQEGLKLTVGSYTNTSVPTPSPIVTINPVHSVVVPAFNSHRDLLSYYFPTSYQIYLYDGSGNVVNVNSSGYGSTFISSNENGQLYFLQNSYLSSNDLVRNLVTNVSRLTNSPA